MSSAHIQTLKCCLKLGNDHSKPVVFPALYKAGDSILRQPIKIWNMCHHLQKRAPFVHVLDLFMDCKTNKSWISSWPKGRFHTCQPLSHILQGVQLSQASRNCFAAASNCSTAWNECDDPTWSNSPLDCQKQPQMVGFKFLAIPAIPAITLILWKKKLLSMSFCFLGYAVFSCQALQISVSLRPASSKMSSNSSRGIAPSNLRMDGKQLVGGWPTLLKNMLGRQFWWLFHSQDFWKSNPFMFQSPPTSHVYLCFSQTKKNHSAMTRSLPPAGAAPIAGLHAKAAMELAKSGAGVYSGKGL